MGLRLRNRTPVACAGLCVSLLLVGTRASAATQVLAPSDDTFINSQYPTNNNGGSSSIFTGSDDQGGVMRGLIRFGMPLGLQGRVTVTNVQLDMTIRALENGNPGPGAVENLQAVTQSWLQGNGVGDGLFVGEACISGTTWDLSDCAAVTYWTTAGATVAGASSGTASTAGIPIDGTVTWSSAGMISDVQSWIDVPSNNHGWRISSTTEAVAASAQRFYSAESGLSAPSLAITYVCKPGFVASGNDCAQEVASSTPTFTATETPTPSPTAPFTPTPTATLPRHQFPDLLETAVSNPPPVASRGASFVVTDTVANQGDDAGASTTRYYLALDVTKRSAHKLLGGERAVATLASLASSTGMATVSIPLNIKSGMYFFLACADDRHAVGESDPANNCLAAAAMIVVGP